MAKSYLLVPVLSLVLMGFSMTKSVNCSELDSPYSLRLKAEEAMKLCHFAQAEKLYRQGVDAEKLSIGQQRTAQLREQPMTPVMMALTVGLAQALQGQGLNDKAEALLRETVIKAELAERELPRPIILVQAYDALARTLEKQAKTEEALLFYAKLSALNPNAHSYGLQSAALRRYAVLLRQKGDRSTSIQIERRAKELERTDLDLKKSGLDY